LDTNPHRSRRVVIRHSSLVRKTSDKGQVTDDKQQISFRFCQWSLDKHLILGLVRQYIV
jgi:hypothetical protein